MSVTPLNLSRIPEGVQVTVTQQQSPRDSINFTPRRQSISKIDKLAPLSSERQSPKNRPFPQTAKGAARDTNNYPFQLNTRSVQPSPRGGAESGTGRNSILGGEYNMVSNSKVRVPAPLGSWMNSSTKKDPMVAAAAAAAAAGDQAYNSMASAARSKNDGSVMFRTRNRSMQVNSQLSHHTDNLQKTCKNILGNGQDEKMSNSAMSTTVPSLVKNKGRNISSLTMTARDFVMSSLKKDSNFGIQGYSPANTMTNFDGPLVTKIHSGKKKTFVDDAVKQKLFVPDAKYNVTIDWTRNKKSDMAKDKRHTLATDAENFAKKFTKPEPSTYKINEKHVTPKVVGAFNLKGKLEDTSFLAQPAFVGHNSPRFYDKKHHAVEKRVKSLAFRQPINEKLDKVHSYMRNKQATHLISPASHNPLESLKTAVMPKQTFYMRKGSPKSHIDNEIKRAKMGPGAGHYNLKNIENAYNKITLGASRGWK